MKLGSLLNVVLFVAILIVLLMLTTIDPGRPGINPTLTSLSDTTNEKTASIESQIKENAPISSATEPARSQVATFQDGSSLLHIHCAQCHHVRLLEQTRKTRADWERTLSRMERISVHLSDTERSVLLDHLATPEK